MPKTQSLKDEVVPPADCYLCGRPSEDRDHVVPRSLFPRPLPSNLITLPSCEPCNQGLKLDEERFRVFVLGNAYSHPEAKRVWHERVMTRLPSQQAFRSSLLRNLRPSDIYSEGGVYLGRGDVLLAEKKQVNRVLRKMVTGLARHHVGVSLIDTAMEIVMNPSSGLWSALSGHLQRANSAEVGNGVLRYWWRVADDEPRASMWWLLFYDHVMFVVMSEPPISPEEENKHPDTGRPGG